MKIIHRSLVLLLVVGTAMSSGCITTQQVEAIVAESNAAMVEPYYHAPHGKAQSTAAQAIEKIDAQIAAHPENKVLVNHLRVRQAMILTVDGQKNLAELRWGTVESSELKNERERALYQSRAGLVFAYARLKETTGLTDDEKKAARNHLTTMQDAIAEVGAGDIVIYLQMIRAEIGLKLADSMDEEQEKSLIEDQLATSLDEFIAAFSENDLNWVQKNWNTTDVTAEMTIQDLRQRIWLRELLKMYFKEANDKNLSPAWSDRVRVFL